MPRKSNKKPTDAELEVLQVLWDRGPSTVRQVFLDMEKIRPIGYTTVLKVMQIMTEKGLVQRDQSIRPQVYRASKSQGQTQRQMISDLVERAFSGSPGHLVLQALSTKKASAEDLRKIRELLDKLEEKSS